MTRLIEHLVTGVCCLAVLGVWMFLLWAWFS